MENEKTFFDITLHRMKCSKGDYSSLYNMTHVNGQIIATSKCKKHDKRGTEIFIKRLLPEVLLQDILEFVVFMGIVYQIRILLEFSGYCRGYAFVKFFEEESARQAMILLNGQRINNSTVYVYMSFDNNRLEIQNIPKGYSAKDVYKELSKTIGKGLQNVMFTKSKNVTDSVSGIVTYNTHRNALEARKVVFDCFELFDVEVKIDWAVPEEKFKGKRLYFNALPYEQITKSEIYYKVVKLVTPKKILNIFLLSGLGYITFVNESVAYDAFKALKNITIGPVQLKFAFQKFFDSLPKTEASSKVLNTSDLENQIARDPAIISAIYSISTQLEASPESESLYANRSSIQSMASTPSKGVPSEENRYSTEVMNNYQELSTRNENETPVERNQQLISFDTQTPLQQLSAFRQEMVNEVQPSDVQQVIPLQEQSPLQQEFQSRVGQQSTPVHQEMPAYLQRTPNSALLDAPVQPNTFQQNTPVHQERPIILRRMSDQAFLNPFRRVAPHTRLDQPNTFQQRIPSQQNPNRQRIPTQPSVIPQGIPLMNPTPFQQTIPIQQDIFTQTVPPLQQSIPVTIQHSFPYHQTTQFQFGQQTVPPQVYFGQHVPAVNMLEMYHLSGLPFTHTEVSIGNGVATSYRQLLDSQIQFAQFAI